MEYRKLGRTGLNVSLICLGTMTWGRQNTQADGHEQMDYALTQGVNFFDTAEMYPIPANAQTAHKTEEIIGTWFAARKNRDQIILASKIVGAKRLPWIRGADHVIDRKNILEAVEGSLKRLQTDYIDLYQLHWPNRNEYHWGKHWNFEPDPAPPARIRDNFLEVLQTLDGLIKAGKIRHIGLSNESAWGSMEYLRLAEQHGLPRMVSIQNEYSLLCRNFEPDLSEIAQFEDIGLLAWSPLAGGMISGKYLDGARPPNARWTIEGGVIHRDTPLGNAAVRAYIDVAQKHGLDVCQMAIAFVNARKFVTSTIIGATTMEHLKSNIDAVNLKLSAEVLADIEAVRRRYPMPY